jgi:hypothetical protein
MAMLNNQRVLKNPSLEFNPGGVSRVYAASRVVNAPSCELLGAQRARCYVEADDGQRGRVMFNVEHLGFVWKQATHKKKSSCSPLKIIKVYWNGDLGMYPSHYSWLDPLTHKHQEIQNLIKIIGLDLNKESFCSGPRMTKNGISGLIFGWVFMYSLCIV